MSKKSRPRVARAPSKKQLTKWDRERRLQRLVIICTAIIVALVIGVPAFGYYREVIARGQEAIAVVNDKPLTMDQYVRLLSFRQYQLDIAASYLSQQPQDPSQPDQLSQQLQLQRATLPTQVVYDWVDGEVTALGASKLGISVTSDEVWQETKKELLGDPQPDQQVDEAKRDADAQDQIKQLTDATGITADEFRHEVEVNLLRQKVDKQLTDQIVTPTLQVRVQLILVNSEEDIQSAYKRIQDGEDFAKVAKEVSIDANSKDNGGELGWVPKGLRSAEFDKVVFDMKPGQTSEPFNSSEGYYIVKVEERDEARDLDQNTLSLVKAGAFDRWLEEQKASVKQEIRITSDKQLWAQDKLAKESAKRAKKAQQAAK